MRSSALLEVSTEAFSEALPFLCQQGVEVVGSVLSDPANRKAILIIQSDLLPDECHSALYFVRASFSADVMNGKITHGFSGFSLDRQWEP